MMIGDGCSAFGILYIFFCIQRGGASLTEICIGVAISSIFSSLLEPSYRATITDLLDAGEYSRASGLVGLAGSARYLISPILAGALLAVSDIRILLVLDICTFLLTVICTGVVRRAIERTVIENRAPFFEELKTGWKAVAEKRGVLILIFVASVMTCFMGAFQILAEPLILDFADSATLGVGETVCASGMLVSSLFLGIRGIRREYVKVLSASLVIAGTAMVIFGMAGILADGIGEQMNIGVGRGAAAVIMISGVMLSILALAIYPVRDVRLLEDAGMQAEGGMCYEKKNDME